MRIAVTGAGGRLGSALVRELSTAGEVRGWSRPDYDLDDPRAAGRIVESRPDVVVHAAAWTDVDGCAREPTLAFRRNAEAVDELARATSAAGIRLVVVSTNEVFDGDELRRAYRPGNPVGPKNPYGASKLRGEESAQDAYVGWRDGVLIVRTAWLFGPPGNDFPTKIVAAARRARASDQPLRLVRDEIGSPSLAGDVARGISALVVGHISGVRHVVNAGRASRAEWAQLVLDIAGLDVATELVPASTWKRDSTPPLFCVLASDVLLRTWEEATREYVTSHLVEAARA
ncbi:MAG TPA: NAD(P)-dependent oxidoreductase [Candidatus Limnocylindria bacterium]|nr:NAD(P)-dependent oxidoreductase [Candidatus Limnocylindria bacterium]